METIEQLVRNRPADQARIIEFLGTKRIREAADRPARYFSESPSVIAKEIGMPYPRAKAALAALVAERVVAENHPTQGRSTFRLWTEHERVEHDAKLERKAGERERVTSALRGAGVEFGERDVSLKRALGDRSKLEGVTLSLAVFEQLVAAAEKGTA